MLLWRVARHLLAIVGMARARRFAFSDAGAVGSGFDTDEHQLDPSLSAESVHALRESRAGEQNVLRYYTDYLKGAVHGNLGVSHTLGQPVRNASCATVRPVTLRIAGIGLLLGWLLATALAFAFLCRGCPLTEFWYDCQARHVLSAFQQQCWRFFS